MGNDYMGTSPNRQTHMTENITFKQLRWRPVKMCEDKSLRSHEPAQLKITNEKNTGKYYEFLVLPGSDDARIQIVFKITIHKYVSQNERSHT